MKELLPLGSTYVLRARLQPALIVVLPVALAVLAYFPGGLAGWGILSSVLVTCGGTALLAQVARDRGKRKEQELFERWGAKPTTQLLRHGGASNRVKLARLHTRLQLLVAGISIPTEEAERSDPAQADEVYDACTAYLIEKTRNRQTYPLIFEENCNYGFRRNLWGMKPLGLSAASLSVAAIAALFVAQYRNGVVSAPLTYACGGLTLVLFLGWLVWFTPSWVKIAADAYAERLLASCESLQPARV